MKIQGNVSIQTDPWMTAEQELWKKLEKNLTLQENVSVRSKQKHCVS